MRTTNVKSLKSHNLSRRGFLGAGTLAITPFVRLSLVQREASLRGSLTKERLDSMTPSQIIEELKKGNERFRSGKMTSRDYRAGKKASASGQYPAAVVLGCLDSRVPAEIIFDTGIGDAFVGRVAGNVVNDDLLGSMEFEIRRRSPILEDLKKKGTIKITRAMYDLSTGMVDFVG